MSAGTTGVDEVAVAEASRAASRRGGDEDDGAALGSSSSRSRSNRGREGRGEIFSGGVGVWARVSSLVGGYGGEVAGRLGRPVRAAEASWATWPSRGGGSVVLLLFYFPFIFFFLFIFLSVLFNLKYLCLF